MTFNLTKLVKKGTINIKYNSKRVKSNCNYFKRDIIEYINILNSLSYIYLSLYNIIMLKQKVLISSNSKYLYSLKHILYLSNCFYTYNKLNLEIFTNIFMLKRKLIVYMWLEYFLFYNLILKNNWKKKVLKYHLYTYYIKLRLKYNNIKQLKNIPNLICFLFFDNIKNIRKILKLDKNIILITNKKLKMSRQNMYILNLENINSSILYFILKIIFTSIFQGTLCLFS